MQRQCSAEKYYQKIILDSFEQRKDFSGIQDMLDVSSTQIFSHKAGPKTLQKILEQPNMSIGF